MPIFDTHAHYDAEQFDADRDAVLTALPAQGVCAVIQCATDPDSVRKSLVLAEKYPYIRVAVGIHPEAVAAATPDWLEAIRAAAAHPAVCAIGEIGLDYHWEDNAPRAVQLDWCRQQIELALELDRPVIFHDRDAHEDTLHLLREYKPRGVLHCFSGSAEMARQITDLGMYIGLGGATTFKNARKPVEVAGLRLVPTKDFTKITTAQFVDFKTFTDQAGGDESRLSELTPAMLSCMLTPQGRDYCDGYDPIDVQAAIRDHLRADDALALSAFFLSRWIRSSSRILTYSRRVARRYKMTETLRKIRELARSRKALTSTRPAGGGSR